MKIHSKKSKPPTARGRPTTNTTQLATHVQTIISELNTQHHTRHQPPAGCDYLVASNAAVPLTTQDTCWPSLTQSQALLAFPGCVIYLLQNTCNPPKKIGTEPTISNVDRCQHTLSATSHHSSAHNTPPPLLPLFDIITRPATKSYILCFQSHYG